MENNSENKPAEIKPKMIMCNNVIIKVQEETKDCYIGYDVFSECLCIVKKNPKAIEVTEAVITLLGCEKSRFKLANALGARQHEVAKLLNVNERTVFRMYNEYDMFNDYKLIINKKISETQTRNKAKTE